MNKGKKILGILLCAVMLFPLLLTTASAKSAPDTWDGSVATQFAGGSGTSNDPYQIATGAQLAFFVQSINAYQSGDTDYRLSYIVLTNDINLNGHAWTPIGHTRNNYSASQYFGGDFDGDQHTISGMSISLASPGSMTFSGLFGISTASIHDVNVSGSIHISGTFQMNYIAGICGYLAGDLNNCTSDVSIAIDGSANGSFIGGVVGYLNAGANISNSINRGSISIPNTKSFSRIGGIAGCISNNCTISACKNEGAITTAIGMAGGIVGEMMTSGKAGTVAVRNSYHTGSVTMTGATSNDCIGGIAGGIHALNSANPSSAVGILENCFSAGDVSMTIVKGTGTCGPVYGNTNPSTEGNNSYTNCYYVNDAVGASANQAGTKVSADALNSAAFLNSISGGTEGLWVQSNTGAVVLKCELADYSAVSDAIAKVPSNLTPYTGATVAAVTKAVNAVVQNRLKAEQSIVDGYASAIEKAISALLLKPVTPPHTGDSSATPLWIGLLIVSAGAMVTLAVAEKRKKQNAR